MYHGILSYIEQANTRLNLKRQFVFGEREIYKQIQTFYTNQAAKIKKGVQAFGE